jgi:hypothetical protein
MSEPSMHRTWANDVSDSQDCSQQPSLDLTDWVSVSLTTMFSIQFYHLRKPKRESRFRACDEGNHQNAAP